MIKCFLTALSVLCLLLSLCFNVCGMTIYHPDGSTKEVKESLTYIIPEGWFNEPVCYIYKPDGTKSVAFIDQLQRYLDNGWYEKPVCAVYGKDGESKVVYTDEKEKYLSDGWSAEYVEPKVYVYKSDGSTASISKSELEKYILSGWIDDINNVTQYVYSRQGEHLRVFVSEVPGYVAGGWFTAPVCVMYHKNGSSILVYESHAKTYMKLGYSLYKNFETYENVRTVGVTVVVNGEVCSPRPYPEVVLADDRICRFPLITAESLYKLLDGKLAYIDGNYYLNINGKTVRFTKNGRAYNEDESGFDISRIMEYEIDGVSYITFDTVLDAAGISYTFDETNLVLYVGDTEKADYSDYIRTLYHPDGRTAYVYGNEVMTYKRLGWFEDNAVKMYSPSGFSCLVDVTSIDSYKEMGWKLG